MGMAWGTVGMAWGIGGHGMGHRWAWHGASVGIAWGTVGIAWGIGGHRVGHGGHRMGHGGHRMGHRWASHGASMGMAWGIGLQVRFLSRWMAYLAKALMKYVPNHKMLDSLMIFLSILAYGGPDQVWYEQAYRGSLS
ncbi:hypothetical protein FEM48_ZijujUnG0003100 [Ziziphus jujuba var. spinosa]|uniref:Uncharacterized protein n=1 Tax=Ziziphus jujuba var. spinosa TaxID=714518 RepID=A0A978UA44_ZIZJJ|nr:hypothetical protein FEM48_ZijujUnG0003100 [Ziziphus jujuba var. spinosa]